MESTVGAAVGDFVVGDLVGAFVPLAALVPSALYLQSRNEVFCSPSITFLVFPLPAPLSQHKPEFTGGWFPVLLHVVPIRGSFVGAFVGAFVVGARVGTPARSPFSFS